MTLTSPEMSTSFVTPTSNHFCQGLHLRRFQFLHLLKWLCEIHSNANVVLSSAPFDKFATRVKMSIVFFWMTDLMRSRELLMKLRRLLTWYFAVCVGVRRHSEAMWTFVAYAELGKQISTICIHLPGIYTWPSNKEPCASRKHILWKTGTFPFHVCMRRHLPRHGPSVYRPIHLGTSKKNYSHEGLIQPVGLQWLSNTRFCRHMNHAQDDMTLIEGLLASQVCSNIARMYSLASSSKCPA